MARKRLAKNSFHLRSLIKIKAFLIIISGFVMFISFQNFTEISIEELRPGFQAAHATSPDNGTGDIRLLAPYRAQAPNDVLIATPQSGADINSLSQDWATRQTRIITGGADERFMNDLNKRLNRILKSSGDDAPDAIDTGDGVNVSTTKSRGPASLGKPDPENDLYGLMPKSVRLMSLNRMQIGLANNKTQISWSVQGQSMQWDLTHPIAKNFDISLHHDTSCSKSSLLLNYNW